MRSRQFSAYGPTRARSPGRGTLHGDAGARIAAGLGFVSGDRARTLIGEWSVARNHSLTTLANRGQLSPLHPSEELQSALSSIQRLSVRERRPSRCGR